jgi:hypothetical protein
MLLLYIYAGVVSKCFYTYAMCQYAIFVYIFYYSSSFRKAVTVYASSISSNVFPFVSTTEK